MKGSLKTFIDMIFFIVCGLVTNHIWAMGKILKNYLIKYPLFLEGVSCALVVIFVAFILSLVKVKLKLNI